MNTYKRLFDTLINNFKDGAKDGLDELINLIEKTGHDALDYIESLDIDTLNELKGEADFNKIYDQFFNFKNDEAFSSSNNRDEWFKEKEKKYKKEREDRKRARENRKSSYERTNNRRKKYNSNNYSSYNESDPYKIFGIPRNSNWKTIRFTYVKLVKKYHPDTRDSNMSTRDKKEADIKLQKIYKAWEYFNDNKRRFK